MIYLGNLQLLVVVKVMGHFVKLICVLPCSDKVMPLHNESVRLFLPQALFFFTFQTENKFKHKSKFHFSGLLTRNNSIDSYEYQNSGNLQKKQIFDAIAAASIVNNCSGVDTSKSQVITLATFKKFLETRQLEKLNDEQIKSLIKVVSATPLDYDIRKLSTYFLVPINTFEILAT